MSTLVTSSMDTESKAARTKARNKVWRETNKEILASKSAAYREAHRQELRDKARVWRSDPANRLKITEYHRLYHYGLTATQYKKMLASQGGKCASCGDGAKLVVDHNHDTDAVRELLCQPCNLSLGALKESPERMLRLVEYINRWT